MKKAITWLTAFALLLSLSGSVTAGNPMKASAATDADILNVDFREGTSDDLTGKHTARTHGNPAIAAESSLNGQTVAHFDGSSAYVYDMVDEDYEKIRDSFTLECLVRYNELPSSGEHDFFSNQQNGGLGLGSVDGSLELLVSVDGSWKEPKASASAGSWYHVVGTYDGTAARLYVNGTLADSISCSGSVTLPNEMSRYFVVGGDSQRTDGVFVQYLSNCSVGFTRLYSRALGAAEIAERSDDALEVKPDTAEADILNVDFREGTSDDLTGKHTARTHGNPAIAAESSLNGQTVAHFDGASAYVYDMADEDYEKIRDSFTLECLVRYNELPSSGEHDFFSNQQSGGLGLGSVDGRLELLVSVGGWKEPKASASAGSWYHVVGTYDGTAARLYVNGKLADSVACSGYVQLPLEESRYFVIGGDSQRPAGEFVQFLSKCSVGFARLYSRALEAAEITERSNDAFEGTGIDRDPTQRLNMGLVVADQLPAGGWANVNLHVNADVGGNVDEVACQLRYDPALMEYKGVGERKAGAAVEESEPGVLQITYKGGVSSADFRRYDETRLVKLNFAVKQVEKNTPASLQLRDVRIYSAGVEPSNGSTIQATDKDLTILSRDRMDLNQDGFIGAGDIALAVGELREAIAQAAAIHPYKHVLVLTMDGAGVVWNPDEMYYASSAQTSPIKTTDADVMALRTSTYAMELINKQFAASYTASAVNPPISAQNYSSILHGIPWQDAESEYQVTNDLAAKWYYADFGRSTALHPSIFSVLSRQLPGRPLAAYAEWAPIPNGIIEPDIPVIGRVSSADRAFYDVASYIKSDAFQNTPLIFMQSDVMDHLGHSSGYYTKTYWRGLKAFDNYFKAVMEALEETGRLDDTLIITNADHGGSGLSHNNPSLSSHMDVFIALGGLTVDSGRRLDGGSNADIPALVLEGLRLEKPAEMSKSTVFDRSAFLTQEELSKKQRNVEKAFFLRNGCQVRFTLENPQSDTRVIDAVIALNGNTVEDIQTEGTVLRRTVENDRLRLTIAYDRQPQELATLTFAAAADTVKASEIMLGAADGSETYCDLANTTADQALVDAQAALKTLLDSARAIDLSTYTEESAAALKAALDTAAALYENPQATIGQLIETTAVLRQAMDALQPAGTGSDQPEPDDKNDGTDSTGSTSPSDDAATPDNPKTGDTSSAAPLLLLAASALLILIPIGKKRISLHK